MFQSIRGDIQRYIRPLQGYSLFLPRNYTSFCIRNHRNQTDMTRHSGRHGNLVCRGTGHPAEDNANIWLSIPFSHIASDERHAEVSKILVLIYWWWCKVSKRILLLSNLPDTERTYLTLSAVLDLSWNFLNSNVFVLILWTITSKSSTTYSYRTNPIFRLWKGNGAKARVEVEWKKWPVL